MVFSGLVFLYIFLPAALLIYFAVPGIGKKNIILTALSLLFYAWGEPVWVVLLVFSSLQDYIAGRVIGRYRGQWQAKLALTVSLVGNFSLLGFFKYIDFFIGNLNLLLNTAGAHTVLPFVGVALPIGISFYTFQTVSYSIDCYRGKVDVQRNFTDFLLFVSLFPQLTAGPILRYATIEKQLRGREHSWSAAAYGFTRFAIGLGKKVLLANYAGRVVSDLLADPSAVSLMELQVSDAWLGILMYTFQIYFDFSGYSDMAIGLGRIFGFSYPENFLYPYISRSVTEFWRRWHISLSSFFRDYVYIPLGGNRRGRLRQLFNLLAVWFLTGLWHGAAWNFVVWGMYYAVLLLLEKFIWQPAGKKLPLPGFIKSAAGWCYTFIAVVIGWVFFYTPDPVIFGHYDLTSGPLFYLQRSLQHLASMLGFGRGGFAGAGWGEHVIILVIFAAACTPLPAMIGRRFTEIAERSRKAAPLFGAVRMGVIAILLFLSTAQLVGATYNPFIYFRF
jgi:alginate O-acetyltransferase complex protein AlgI